MHVFCMRGTSMGSIRKRSSVSPQRKDAYVGIMLKQTNQIHKYLRRDTRYCDVHPENGFINCKEREGGWVQLVLFFHLTAANAKPRVTTIAQKAVYMLQAICKIRQFVKCLKIQAICRLPKCVRYLVKCLKKSRHFTKCLTFFTQN